MTTNHLSSCQGARGETRSAIVGAIEKTYSPEDVTAVKIADNVSITLVEESPCGVSFQFPAEMQPGIHPIGDRLTPGVLVYGEYSPDCGASGSYLSTEGALTLTSSGGRYSGTVEFSAALATDKTKTISIAGSFRDAVLR